VSPSVPKAKAAGSKQYRFVGTHAEILESGAPIGHGEYITLDDSDMVGVNATMLEDGDLIDATGVTPPETMSVEVEATPTRGTPPTEERDEE
jgi:hypothetical protein